MADAKTSPAPRQIRSRETEFEALIQGLQSGVALIDASGRFTLYNRRFLEMFGLAQDADIENVNSQNWAAWQVLDPGGRLLHFDEHPVRRAVLGRRAVRDQLVAVRLPAGGDLRWMLVSAEPMLTSDGAISEIICTYHDVTAQRRAEERAARRDAQLRFAMDASLAIVFEWDIARDSVRRIQSAEVALPADGDVGRTLEEVADVVHPADRDVFRANVRAALDAPDGRYRSEFRILRPDGEVRWLTESGGVEFDHERRPLRLVGISIDVTERRRSVEELQAATERLRQAHERLRLHVASTPLALVEWSADYRVVGYSPRAQAIFGYAPEEVLGKRLDEIPWVPEEDWPAVEAVMRDMTAAVRPTNVNRNRNRRKDGSIIHCEWYSSTLYDERGHMLSVLSFVLDVTERVHAEEALRDANGRLLEAERRKDEFLATLSHELRNPLAPIRNSTYILQHAAPASEQALRAQAVIHRQTEHLTRLVDDLLDVTRIARGKIELRRARIDLADVVRRAGDDFSSIMRERGVQLAVAVPDEAVWADADATRITQVTGNLLHNASKFTRPGDTVTLSIATIDGAAEIRVRDTGAGIDPDLLPLVFDAFVQGERSLARTDSGLGLGLALVKAITELHGGTVRAESAGKGHGAEFTVRLPRSHPAIAEARAGAHPERPNGGRRVLVVDDNRDAAESLAEIVRMLGHAADVAYDGPTAIEKVLADPPDVVLCDIGLPGMSGYDVAQALRARAPDGVQLIAVSGYAQPEDVERAIEAGFDGHVAKPCDPERIERLLS